jgi:tetratricopeptide (TPR) repeat protein
MNHAARSIPGFLILCIASLCAVAQQSDPVFLKIELAIRQDEPQWTLMNRWSGPQGRSAGLRWKSDQHEIFAWIITERTVDEAIRFFEDDGLGTLPNKTPRRTLNIGDGAYLRQAGPHTIIVLRKGNLLVRLGSESSGAELLSRFASHIGAALDESSVTASNAKEVTGSAEGHYRQGVDYLKAGDKTKATEAFREAVRLRPEWAAAHYQLGMVYYETGEYKAAANAFEEAIRLQPEFFDALSALGKTYQHLGLHVRAVEVLQKAVLLRADNIDARTALGTALILAAQPQEAVAVLREAARLGPESALIYTSLGQAYRLSGKFDEALIALEQALRLSPEDAAAHKYLALTYTDLGRQRDALAAYKRAIALKADYAEAHYNLGLLYVAIGERSQAQAEYEVLKRLRSDLADALLRRIR